MKGINTITAANDPGQDGITPATGINLNDKFGTDVAAFGLQYFNGDYVAINGQTPMASVNNSSNPASNSSALYNGNIRYMQTRLTNPTTGADMPMLNAYQYDQLNRLIASRSYESGLSSNVWNPTSYGNEYYNAFTYDAMGNITRQLRHSRSGAMIDNLTYNYQTNNGKLVRNRLYHLNDSQTNSAAFTDDIDNMLTFRPEANRINVNNNYNYDEEGRLVKDSSERINKIVWRVDGKVKEIQRGSDTSKRWLRFDYDALGHRIAKHVYNYNGTVLKKSTYYILDASGNQISTYDYEVVGGNAQFNLKERNIYCSSRVGSKQDSMNVLTATLNPYKYTRTLGWKYYEFSNHLGNVLTVYTDVKVPLDGNANSVVDGYKVKIVDIADYSPFGVQLDGRTMQADFYRYGFQHQEKDNEIKGFGNSINFEFRMHDPRVGRFFAVDPKASKFPWQSPYTAMDDNPINIIDPTGESGEPVIDKTNKTITVTSNITFYGADGTAALATKSAQNIQDQWNAAAGKVTIGGDVYDVKFVVSGTYSSTLTASDITSNTDIKNNYVKIVASGIDVSYMDGVGSNTGEFLVSNINATNSTTETHEFGHGFGLDHPTNTDLRTPAGSTTPTVAPSIMYPRGTAVDATYTYDPTKGATTVDPNTGARTNTMNPTTRKVTQTDIDNLGLDKVTYDPTTGKGQLGKLTNTSH